MSIEILARAMGKVLPGYCMPYPKFEETERKPAVWSSNPNLLTVNGRNYNEAMEEYYLKERDKARELYIKLAQEITDEIIKEVLKSE